MSESSPEGRGYTEDEGEGDYEDESSDAEGEEVYD
jgi:hypothetical protein